MNMGLSSDCWAVFLWNLDETVNGQIGETMASFRA